MEAEQLRYSPGRVRDAIIHVMSQLGTPVSVKELEMRIGMMVGPTSSSSIRSYLRLNTPKIFTRLNRGIYQLTNTNTPVSVPTYETAEQIEDSFTFGDAKLIRADCFDWITKQKPNSIHAVVTDPPYGLLEYSEEQQSNLRKGSGCVWRIPPSFDGHARSPLPLFTTLSPDQLIEIQSFFGVLGRLLLPKLVPGAMWLSRPILYCPIWFRQPWPMPDWNAGAKLCG